MSQYAAELCTLLVEDNFGDLFGRIYATLVQYGRLILPRLRDHAQITHKQLLHALAAMVQMNLVHHFTSLEDGLTYYEANIDAAYYLIRTGKVLELVEERLGSYAAQVMSAIAYHGHVQIADLETLPELRANKRKKHLLNGASHDADEPDYNKRDDDENATNGIHDDDGPANGDHATDSRLHATLKFLAGHGYISRVRDTHFHSLGDNTLEAEREAEMQVSADTKTKKAAEIEIKKQEILARRLDGDLSQGLQSYAVPPVVNKRQQANGHSAHPAKRRRLDSLEDEIKNNDSWDGDDGYDMDDHEPMESSIVVRVNYQKIDVVFRNRRLVELAVQGTSPVTAQVYETLLRLIEYRTPRCRDTNELPREGEENETASVPITLQRLANEIDPLIDLTGSLGPNKNPNPQTTSKTGKRGLTNGVNGNHYDDDEDDDSGTVTTRTYDVGQHLALLAQPPYKLSIPLAHGSIPTWKVEFRRLARQLRHLEIERIVGLKFGRIALRLIRILLEKGKLDEKRLQEISLVSQKDLRQVLAQMQENGFVDLQEVPRDAQRVPNRTVFLWFYDPDRVGRNLLHDTYKAMSRCLQRLRFERARLKDFLDKTERSDLKEHLELYLSDAEKKTLQQWQDKEALMLAEISRLDDLVAVFRDF